MTEPMVTMTGPARLRALADDANTQGFMWLSQDLRQLAALWEADLSYAAGLIADEILRAERAEAALDRATNDLMLSEESFVTMRAKRDEVLSELRTTRAALERARALLAEQAEIITANVWHIPPEYSARNIVMDAAAKMRDLAALLASASGGAA